MSIARLTYLKGLAEGLNLGNDTKEEKILRVIIEVLTDMSAEIAELKEDVEDLDDELSTLVEDVEELEGLVEEIDESLEELEDLCEEADAPTCCDGPKHRGGKHQFFEVTCPSCDSDITIDENVMEHGEIDCPSCGEHLELED